jgi:hypothetical protein
MIHQIKRVWKSKYKGVKCLESETEYGFFKSDADMRPSSCTWIKKNKIKSTTQLSLGDINDNRIL